MATRLLKRLLNQDTIVNRRLVTNEIRDITILLHDDDYNPEYAKVFFDFHYRMRRLDYPECLRDNYGMQKYLDFLIKTADPRLGEIRFSHLSL